MRYYALEALYNIAKVTREDFMPFFTDTFDALFRLCGDMDSAVHQATTFLDNLMKVSGKIYAGACVWFFKTLAHGLTDLQQRKCTRAAQAECFLAELRGKAACSKALFSC